MHFMMNINGLDSLWIPIVFHSAPLVNLLGQISLEEFIEGAEKDPWVMDQLKLDIGPCDWFICQQEKKH